MAIDTGLNWLVYVDTNENLSSPNWVKLPQQKGGQFSGLSVPIY